MKPDLFNNKKKSENPPVLNNYDKIIITKQQFLSSENNNTTHNVNSHKSNNKSLKLLGMKVKRIKKIFTGANKTTKKYHRDKIAFNHHHTYNSNNNINNITLSQNLDEYEQIPVQEKLQMLLNNKEKLDKINSLVSPKKVYTQLLFRSVLYNIGDKLLILSQNEILIGELLRIIPKNGNKLYPFWPTIEVKWYYKKQDINRKKNNLIDISNYNSISEFELFPSEHKDIIFIETLIGKCYIYSYDEYEKLSEHNEYIYFTRANYDPFTQLLSPKFNEWEKGCVCRKPLNPDQFYIKCDYCNNWFHPKCCGLSQENAEKLNIFICPKCKK